MIAITGPDDAGVMELTVSGRLSKQDYDAVLAPAIDAALSAHDKIRILVLITEDFEGYDLGAAWSDTKLGMTHWSGFDRIALVTDVGWIAGASRGFAFLAPCPVKVFDLASLDEARDWLREPLGGIEVIAGEGGVLTVRLVGKLEPAAYDDAREALYEAMDATPGFRLLLDLRDFDGWQGLSGVLEHLSLVRGRRTTPERVAVLGNTGWQRMAERVIKRFVRTEANWFEDPAEARAWAAGT